MAHKIAKALSVFLLIPLLFACTKKTSENPAPANELRIFTWSEYFDDQLLKEFENENHAKVKADYFSSNEQMLAKLQLSMEGKAAGYDLILPTDYMVRNLIELKLLKPLDHAKLSFLKDFDPEAMKAEYDPGLRYSLPMAIGTTGLAVNTKLAGKIDLKNLSWRDVFENPAFAGKASMLDDSKEVLQAALLLQGKHLGNATDADVKKAFEYLRAHKKNLLAFTGETRPVIEADECVLCQVYSGDALNVAKEKPEIQYVIPKEGASVWSDNFAIPVNARNEALAYAFINKILGSEGARMFTERTRYPTANLAAKKLVDPALSFHPGIYFPADVKKRLRYIVENKKQLLMIDKEWTELKSR